MSAPKAPSPMRIHHVTLIVSDLPPAAAFYRDELGFEPIEKEGLDYPGAFFRVNAEQQLHLAELPDVPPSFRGHFCLRTRNFNALLRRFRQLGILDTAPWDGIRRLGNGSYQFYVRDPAGNLVEITSEPADEAEIDPAVRRVPEWDGTPFRLGDR